MTEYVECLQEAGVQISMADAGAPEQNEYAERLIRTSKEEEVNLSDYEDEKDAKKQLKEYVEDVSMRQRFHSSLGYLTPSEFENLQEEGGEHPVSGGKEAFVNRHRGNPCCGSSAHQES